MPLKSTSPRKIDPHLFNQIGLVHMTEVQTPPWLAGWKPTPPSHERASAAGNPNWYKGMPVSPNPAGRPKGVTPQSKLVQKMLENADGILDQLISKAMEGDTNAASLILSRILPSIKAQMEKVSFAYNADAPVSGQVSAVLDAVATGMLAPDVARLIIESIKALAEVRAVETLEARIEALEATHHA